MLKNDIKKELKILYYDLETVALERDKDGCVFWQLSGCIEIDGEVVEEFNYLVNPGDEANYEDGCMEFNDLTIEQVKGYTHHAKVYEKFLALLEKHCNKYDKTDKMFLIGYNNISFDNPRLRDWFNCIDKIKANKYQTFGSYFWSNSIDVFPLLSLLFIKYRNVFENFKLETVGPKCAELGLIDKKFGENTNFHDAKFDIDITRALFHMLCNAFKLNVFDNPE